MQQTNARHERRERADAKLKNARISLMRSIKHTHYEDSVQVYGAFTGFLWSPIKQYFYYERYNICMLFAGTLIFINLYFSFL
jgi:hypothetical protein